MQPTRHAIVAATIFSFCASLALSLCAGSAVARPLQPAEEFFTLPYDGKMPGCDDWITLQEIAARLHDAEAFGFNSPLQITGFTAIRETGFRSNGPDLVPRRFCAARAMFNDQRERTLKYNLIERGGFAGIGRGVEWCVIGLDRYHAYSPNCEGVGP
ncbi:hypothetical protein QM467_02130 [Rhodoblastus sp. 17X3]|uniref:hypothetical protein n=1 Tax=Rhodoblastus sp. 17X3 TaxID=3047026 RepID=UPI0024B788B8|nr:hypothetical protein [Rhodoblastus sp. 17X3]MDI9846852.1 hypothetical protein [Rhodoblastus sp. 17X3]